MHIIIYVVHNKHRPSQHDRAVYKYEVGLYLDTKLNVHSWTNIFAIISGALKP